MVQQKNLHSTLPGSRRRLADESYLIFFILKSLLLIRKLYCLKEIFPKPNNVRKSAGVDGRNPVIAAKKSILLETIN